jgi:hypothetical protein
MPKAVFLFLMCLNVFLDITARRQFDSHYRSIDEEEAVGCLIHLRGSSSDA